MDRVRMNLVDPLGRVHRDLRISLTDRCSLRCIYCMPAEGVPLAPAATMLTADEIVRVAGVAVQLGVTEIRLTGGEPLLRPDIVDIVRRLAGLTGHPEVSATTNGLRLSGLAQPLADAGLRRVNVSLDTLDRLTFVRLTRRDKLTETLTGIEAARTAGLAPVKINTVLLRDVNLAEAPTLLGYALDHGLELRFIEQMPLDAGHTWTRQGMVTTAEILDLLSTRFTLTQIPRQGVAPAERWLVDSGPATVGIIGSVTRPFCGTCDRIRLTSDGQLRNCLFATAETDLRGLLRGGADDEAIATALRVSVAGKAAGHLIATPEFRQPDRPMSAIGG